ncbi:protein TIC 100 [Malania oleifera]|uniref:protein TIC 100 n=1 Tax=Malania oleifera TaxID=397392 RepID=UPI0025ADB3D4|nr:protein TIC 100 [Malania oleifera]
MAVEDSTEPTKQQENESESEEEEEEGEEEEPVESSSSSSSEESDSDSDESSASDELIYVRPGQAAESADDDNSAEANIRRFSKVLDSKRLKKTEDEEDRKYVYYEDLFDFPKDPENWREEDLKELWADAPLEMTKPGWDPVWADEDDWDVVREEIRAGRDPPIAPFYLPYRKSYPVIPDNHYDISNPKAVIEELDRIEEFLKWVSYIFLDGSSYEGTVWDDLAHGKGVYVAEHGLVRYEGEWLQNNMEGHGVVEVEIPDIEPVPGSKLEAKMRAEGKIISRDFMPPKDKEWLEMDIEDSIRLVGGEYITPFYENDEWVRQFGSKPEKGRYRYAGQWKHSRMHGCGVYQVNERIIYGRFYFGELLEEDTYGCDEDTSALHAGIADVAAAKARMFVNKPDGMVREEKGLYSDPQHPYLYEEDDVWMAPGFINQFYEVPDYWKTYVHEVDQEREMWLNSFYRAPLRLPMPAELEHWWSKDETPEFILINKEPEPDPEDPSKLIYTEDPLILHTPTGRIINYIEDEKHGVRLFWQPHLKDGEDVDPEKVQFLPLGFDEFYGRGGIVEKETIWKRLIKAVENASKPMCEKIQKWVEEKKKASEMKIRVIEKELELVEAELCLEEAMQDLEEELKMKQKEEEKKMEMGLVDDESTSTSELAKIDEKTSFQEEEEEKGEEEDEDEDDDIAPSSFGSVGRDTDQKKDQNGKKPGNFPFATSSLSFAPSFVLTVPSRLQQSFMSWRGGKPLPKAPSLCTQNPVRCSEAFDSVNFPLAQGRCGILRAAKQPRHKFRTRNERMTQLHALSRQLMGFSFPVEPKRSLERYKSLSHSQQHAVPIIDSYNILSLHTPTYNLESYTKTTIY